MLTAEISFSIVRTHNPSRVKKFLSKNFRKVLLEIQNIPMIDQGKKLDEIFEAYKADIEQVDDVVVIGVRY